MEAQHVLAIDSDFIMATYRNSLIHTSADFEGDISGTLLAPTSCLIGAISVLVHDMYT